MPARIERFTPLPHPTGRPVLGPVLGWAFVAGLLAVIRRLTRQPSLPKMSEQWLLSRQADFHRDQY
ncbi:MAG TPA: hypothetical protein VN654_08065 [Vicinamibacterales bacterium]|jgi:hypothetical protein|nr:hypothetical protein [Vicinamibacterales bacterium]